MQPVLTLELANKSIKTHLLFKDQEIEDVFKGSSQISRDKRYKLL